MEDTERPRPGLEESELANKMKLPFLFLCVALLSGFASAELEVELEDALGKGALARYRLAEQQLNQQLGYLPISPASEAYRLGILNGDGSITVTTVIVEGEKLLVAEDSVKGESSCASRSVRNLSSQLDLESVTALPSVDDLSKKFANDNPDKHLLSNWYCLYQYRTPNSESWETVRCPMEFAGEKEFAKIFDFFKGLAAVFPEKDSASVPPKK